jgi:hypothetical protein
MSTQLGASVGGCLTACSQEGHAVLGLQKGHGLHDAQEGLRC